MVCWLHAATFIDCYYLVELMSVGESHRGLEKRLKKLPSIYPASVTVDLDNQTNEDSVTYIIIFDEDYGKYCLSLDFTHFLSSRLCLLA